MKTVRILCLGDIVGAPGRAVFQKHIKHLKEKYAIDGVIVNGENSARGRGITSRIVKFYRHNGVDVITTGNHIWHYREIYEYLNSHQDLLRPENYPSSCPGTGVTTFHCNGVTIGVLNLQGRVFMRDHVSCPFRAAESVLSYLKSKTNIIIVDFHAEATSEKMGMGFFLDGKVSAVVGTHTHVQTTDNRILPKGTAFMSDLGMAGALNSMIGMKKEPIIQNFLTQMPVKFTVEWQGPMVLSGAWIEIDADSGKAIKIERVRIVDEEIQIDGNEDTE
ncbi:MAG: TIGR00282 family metallophosphoesterase [Candidatus Babeliales bacterium]